MLTPDIAIAGTTVTITNGEPANTNIFMYALRTTNNWHHGGSRVGNGDLIMATLPNGLYTGRVMSLGSPGTVSDSVDFAINNAVLMTNPNPNWDRWVFASISQHFDERRGTIPMFIEGQKNDKLALPQSIELRVDGPYCTETAKNYWRVYVEVNVLVSCVKSNDVHVIRKLTGAISQIFTQCINCYRYGNNPQDDQLLLGILIRVDDERNRERIQTSHFGQVGPQFEMEQATVEAHYVMHLSV